MASDSDFKRRERIRQVEGYLARAVGQHEDRVPAKRLGPVAALAWFARGMLVRELAHHEGRRQRRGDWRQFAEASPTADSAGRGEPTGCWHRSTGCLRAKLVLSP